MRPFIFYQIVFILTGISLESRADLSSWFVELDSTNGFYASPEVPQTAIDALKEAQNDDYEINSFAFTPAGEWVLLENNGFKASSEQVPGYQNLNKNTTCVAFSPRGSRITLYRNGFRGPASAAWSKVRELRAGNHHIRSVSLGSATGFVVLYDETGVSYDAIPAELARILDNSIRENISIECVAFSGREWICLANDNWWTSNTNLPASKIVAQNYRSGLHPKWIAFVPRVASFDAEKFGRIIRQTMAGKLAGGFACEVIDDGKVAIALADGWSRAPWEPKDPSVRWTVSTRMSIASVSKTVTAVAILKLWEERQGAGAKFSLDEPFWPYVSDICPNINEDVKAITIRDLLEHRSGWTNDFGGNPAALRKLLSLPLPHEPGTFYKYEGINYYILHLLIEKISHTDYTAYVQKHVLVPMGIRDMDTRNEHQFQTCAYDSPGIQKSGDPGYVDNSSSAGPGGWFASVQDMGLFLEGIHQNTVLNSSTRDTMFAQNLGWDRGNPWTKGGLGFGPHGGQRHSDIAYFPDGVEAVILLNCAEPVNCETLLVQAWRQAHN